MISARLSTIGISPAGRRLLLAGLSALGYVLCTRLLIGHGTLGSGGDGGGDTIAYWTAGKHVLEGLPVYGPGVGAAFAFLYPPPLAQLFAPLALLPFPAALWLWRGVELIALRVAVGSWRNAGLAMLVWPPVIVEFDAGNVHLLIAAGVAMAIRGDGRLLAPVAITKFASLVALPVVLTRDRRGALLGFGVATLVCLVSFLLSPDLWWGYASFMTSMPEPKLSWYNIGALIPLWLRIGAAALLALAAFRWARLAAVAVTLALPILWVQGLSTLVAAVARPAPRRPV